MPLDGSSFVLCVLTSRAGDATALRVTADDLRASAHDSAPPIGLGTLLRALWLDAHGDWDGAHGIVQDDESRDGAWVHAYLHRKEGDATNAAYWYDRAARSAATIPLDDEWRAIADTLLIGK
ncbi:MAG: hypothetical protein ABTD50_13655 [Polyangiaceae bacterium]|jgi:hypothetical protein